MQVPTGRVWRRETLALAASVQLSPWSPDTIQSLILTTPQCVIDWVNTVKEIEMYSGVV